MTNELSIIRRSNVISDNTFTKLSEISDKLKTGFDNRIVFRPRYLQEVSVLNDVKHPTSDAKYWQCNLERDVHFQNLVATSYDYREKMVDMQIKQIMVDELDTTKPLQRARATKFEIQIERMATELSIMKKEAGDRVREIINWTEIMDELEPKLEFSKDESEEHMAKSYPLRFARQAELIKQVGASDMNGAMNILSLCDTAFNNPRTKKLEAKERQTKKIKNCGEMTNEI